MSECGHVNVFFEKACCSPFSEPIECGCYGQDTIYCKDCGLDDFEYFLDNGYLE